MKTKKIKLNAKAIRAILEMKRVRAVEASGRMPYIFEWPGGAEFQYLSRILMKEFVVGADKYGNRAGDVFRFLEKCGWDGSDDPFRTISRKTVIRMVRWLYGTRPKASRPAEYMS